MSKHTERQDQFADRLVDHVHDEDAAAAMTLHEERLKVGTETVETGRVKLRRYVVTEEQTITVPVSREVLEVRRERVTPDSAVRSKGELTAADVDDSVEVITLREERILVSKEVVEVERVEIVKDKITEERVVTEQVRRERVEIDGADGVLRGTDHD